MAIYAAHGLYAAGCLVLAFPLYKWGLNPSFLENPKGVLTGGSIKDFVNHQTYEMNLKKEIVVIQGQGKGYWSYGNRWFSGKVGIEISKDYKESLTEFNITHQIAHIKAGDHIIPFGGALAVTLFTTLVLAVNYDLFTRYLGGLGAGMITLVFLAKRAERQADMTAMEFCERKVNQAYLDWLLKKEKKGYGRGLLSWIFCLVEPSIDEKIGYFRAHLKLQTAE